MERPVEKLFIAQRGEIALRAGKTFAERGVTCVVPYTFSEPNRLASELVVANPGWEMAALGGTRAEQNFANPTKILETMRLHGCDSIFLGYGFLAEKADFVRMCEQQGITVLAPPSQVMEITGNKISAREVAKKTRYRGLYTIPIVEGSEDLPNFASAVREASKIGYPLMLKDPDLGGGDGNRVANDLSELEKEYKELKGRPENKQIFLEKYIENAVHVEVQIAADQQGHVVFLGERDCTLQRKQQKLIEESPSPHISQRLSNLLQSTAVRYAEEVGYVGLGTVEFIIDRDKKRGRDLAWYFMEVNPRIQVEHPVTEGQIGIDMIGLMLDTASGKPLPFTQADIKPTGHTIEARVYAENPDRNFEKSSGLVSVFRYPEIEGVRVDPALREGNSLSPWYDHTLFKAIAHGPDRETARERLVRLLSGSEVVGVSTNLHFLTELLSTEQFRDGKVSTEFVKNWWNERLKARVHSVSDFVNGGTITPLTASEEFDPNLLPENVIFKRRDGQPISYTEYLERTKEQTGRTCAAEYGIVERDGVQFVLYDLDFSVNAGTLGVQEGNVFVDACRVAHEKGLPLVIITRSGGARQQENSLALFQMGRTVAGLNRYPPKFVVNIYAGPAFGGVNASFAGYSDLQIALDTPDTQIGFTGPEIVRNTIGKEVPEGTYDPLTHYQNRVVHVLVGGLEEASDKIAHLIHNLNIREAISDSRFDYQPKESLIIRESAGRARRFDRPGIAMPAFFGRVSDLLRERLTHAQVEARISHPLSVAERLRVLANPDRPSAADLLDTEMGLFDDMVLLSNPPFRFEGVRQYLPIIAATARIGDEHIFVLAQQTQKVQDGDGRWVKRYAPQRPEDWEYATSMLDFAQKLKLPILFLTDTNGADCSPEAEARNQSHKIAQFLGRADKYPYPVLSILLGMKGSGGGETFVRPFDAAADAENALSFVSTPTVQYRILSGRWLEEDDQELVSYMEQLQDATSEGRLRMRMIDDVIAEVQGGAHLDPKLFASNIREWVLRNAVALHGLSQRGELLDRRWDRIQRVSSAFSS